MYFVRIQVLPPTNIINERNPGLLIPQQQSLVILIAQLDTLSLRRFRASSSDCGGGCHLHIVPIKPGLG